MNAVDITLVLAMDIFHADAVIKFLLLLIGEVAEAVPWRSSYQHRTEVRAEHVI